MRLVPCTPFANMNKHERKYTLSRPGTVFTFYSLGNVYKFLWKMTTNRRQMYEVAAYSYDNKLDSYIETDRTTAGQWISDYRKYVLKVGDGQ